MYSFGESLTFYFNDFPLLFEKEKIYFTFFIIVQNEAYRYNCPSDLRIHAVNRVDSEQKMIIVSNQMKA